MWLARQTVRERSHETKGSLPHEKGFACDVSIGTHLDDLLGKIITRRGKGSHNALFDAPLTVALWAGPLCV